MVEGCSIQSMALRPFLLLSVFVSSLATGPADAYPAAAERAAAEVHTNDLPFWPVERPHKNRYLSVHGLRAFAGGYSEDGLEIWTFPLQLVTGYALDVVRADGSSVRGVEALTSASVDPLSMTRVYRGTDFQVEERMDTRERLPGIRILYRVHGPAGLQIRLHMRPSLNLMWPAGIGGQELNWNAGANGFELKEPRGKFRALIVSPQAATHTQPNNDRRGNVFGQDIQLTLRPRPCGDAHCAVLVFSGQSESDEDAQTTATALLSAPDEPAASDQARYDAKRMINVVTPDAKANRAIRWAQIALEQAWTCNARLGCGLVAGYGPSRGSRRPQYAWYFGGDGLLSTRALIHQGDYTRAAESLEFIIRYQNPDNGMIWHEMSQSAGFVDWTGDYHYMYAHVDIAFDFLDVMAAYDRATGDDGFLRKHWSALLKAWRYCLSTLDQDDGLPRVPKDMMGHNEQVQLTDELTLSAAWVRAAQAMAQLAAAKGDPALADQADAARERALTSLRARYRDAKAQRWISGYTRAGVAMGSRLRADLAAIASGAATAEESTQTLDMIATPAFLTEWGVRDTPITSPDYDPELYASGSVWGLTSASTAQALWRVGRADTAYALWSALLPWADQDSPGHMHEVMSGSAFVPQRESVPEQTWSSAGFLSATMAGLLGLNIDARANALHFAPQPPPSWPTLRVAQIRVGASVVDLEWQRSDTGQTLAVHNRGPSFQLVWSGRDSNHASVMRKQEIPTGSTRLTLP